MRSVIWVWGLFALAVAVALALKFNIGYALLVLPPYRAEISLNLLLLLLLAGFGVGYLLLRFLLGALELPAKVREFRESRAREAARSQLIEAAHAYFEGRYGRAEKAAAAAMESGGTALGAVLAARAAHGVRNAQARDRYLMRAEKLAPHDTALRIIAQADMLLDERRTDEALAALKSLPDKHTAGLRLELKAQQQAKNWELTLPLIDQLERRRVFDKAAAGQLRRYAYAEHLKRKGIDRSALDDAWRKIPTEQKHDAKIAAAAARGFMTLGDCMQANQIIEQALEAEWDSELVGLYGDCKDAEVLRSIDRAERWLTSHPRDAVLLFTLGKLCTRQELWGKAQSYLEASLSVAPTYSAHLALAALHDTLRNADAARVHYRASLELALTELRQMSGGRRRAPV